MRVCGTPALSPSLKYKLVNLASFGFSVIVNFAIKMAEKFDALNKSWKVITDILSPEKQPLPGTVRYSHFLPLMST